MSLLSCVEILLKSRSQQNLFFIFCHDNNYSAILSSVVSGLAFEYFHEKYMAVECSDGIVLIDVICEMNCTEQ